MTVNIDEIQFKLRQLASPAPWRDGLHLGMRDNTNAVEMELAMALFGGIQESRPMNVVELGTGPGYSACWLILGLEKIGQGHLWTVDLVPADEPLWRKYGLPEDRVTYLANETCESAAPQLPDRIDFLFHDAGHRIENVMADLELFLPRLPVGGVVAIHDVNYARGMGDMVRDWFDVRQDEFKYEEINLGCGLGIARRLQGGYVPKSDAQGKLGKDAKENRTTASGDPGSTETVRPRRTRRVANRGKARAAGVRGKTKNHRARRPGPGESDPGDSVRTDKPA